jgi:hypothetical protein
MALQQFEQRCLRDLILWWHEIKEGGVRRRKLMALGALANAQPDGLDGEKRR